MLKTVTNQELQTSFLTLLNKHRGILYRLARSFSLDAEEQADMVQEMTLQLWHAFPQFQGKSMFSTWMYRVGINTMMTYHRKKKREQGGLSTWFHLSDRVAQPHETNDSVAYLYKALNDLSTMERALMFQYLEGLSGRDIAQNLGISEGAVRVKINRTKSKLKTILLTYGYEYE